MEPESPGTPREGNHSPVLDEDQFSPESRRRLSGPGLRTFVRIADLWGLSDWERWTVLGQPARVDYHEWVEAAGEGRNLVLSVDVLTRISAMLGIHQALEVLHHTDDGVTWMRRRDWSTVFGGRVPMEMVTSGSVKELLTVRHALDAATAGHHWVEPNEVDRDFIPYTSANIDMSTGQSTSGLPGMASRFEEDLWLASALSRPSASSSLSPSKPAKSVSILALVAVGRSCSRLPTPSTSLGVMPSSAQIRKKVAKSGSRVPVT